MLNRPVTYDRQNQCLIDSKRDVICHPFRKPGRPDKEFHLIGDEIADCINAYIPPENAENDPGFIPAKFEPVGAEVEEVGVAIRANKPKDAILPPAKEILKPPKRRGRPAGKIKRK